MVIQAQALLVSQRQTWREEVLGAPSIDHVVKSQIGFLFLFLFQLFFFFFSFLSYHLLLSFSIARRSGAGLVHLHLGPILTLAIELQELRQPLSPCVLSFLAGPSRTPVGITP